MNKTKNKIVFKIKAGHQLELLSEGTMQLLGSLKKHIDQNNDGEIVPKLVTVLITAINKHLK